MPLPVITDVMRVVWNYTHAASSTTFHNVMHHRPAGGDASDLADAIEANITKECYDTTGNSFQVTSVDVTPLDGTSATVHRIVAPGVSSSADMIPQGCVVVSLGTAKRGRSFRGRVYIPATQEGAQTNGIINSGNLDNVQDAWDAYRIAMATDLVPLVVASYELASAEDVTTTTARETLYTQRRRAGRQS